MKCVLLAILLQVVLAVFDVGVAFADAAVLGGVPLSNSNGVATAQAVRDIDTISRQLSSKVGFTRSSPECWTTSIATIRRWAKAGTDSNDIEHNVHLSDTSYCASMTNEQLEVLALEVTNCQVMKVADPFFDYDKVGVNAIEVLDGHQPLCFVGEGGMHPYDSSSCLKIMSRNAKDLYQQVFLHTQDICARLMEERMMAQKEEATQMLVYASSAVTQQMQNIMEGASFAVEKMQAQSSLIDDQSIMMREQKEELQHMTNARRQEERESMNVMKKQTALLEEQSTVMKEQQLESERLNKEREHAAALALGRQADKIKEQSRDLERMQEMISSANTQMQPLSNIETYVRLATSGFTVLKSLFNFFISVNVAWVITMIPIVSRSKRYLCIVLSVGFLAEVAIVWFGESIQAGEDEEMHLIEMVRHWTRLSAMFVAMVSSLGYCFFPQKKDETSATLDTLMRSQMEFVSKLNEKAAVENRAERDELPISATTISKSSGKVGEERGRSVARMPENRLIRSNMNFKPRRRRSRSPYRGSLAELALPVVTPVKPRLQKKMMEKATPVQSERSAAAMAAARRSRDDYTAYFVHRSDAIAKQEQDEYRLQLAYMRALQERASAESATSSLSSGEESCSSGSSVSKRSKKRTASEMYTCASSDESFATANDGQPAKSDIPQAMPPAKTQEKKKGKFTT